MCEIQEDWLLSGLQGALCDLSNTLVLMFFTFSFIRYGECFAVLVNYFLILLITTITAVVSFLADIWWI